jgi:hypothetical protein
VDNVHVDWFGDKVETITTTAGRRGLKLAMEHLLSVSTERVPIEEGTLMRSGKSGVDDTELIGMVTYSARNDADDYDYAVRQHEDLTLRHAAGRTAKFLEEPLLEEADTMAKIVAETIRRASQG